MSIQCLDRQTCKEIVSRKQLKPRQRRLLARWAKGNTGSKPGARRDSLESIQWSYSGITFLVFGPVPAISDSEAGLERSAERARNGNLNGKLGSDKEQALTEPRRDTASRCDTAICPAAGDGSTKSAIQR